MTADNADPLVQDLRAENEVLREALTDIAGQTMPCRCQTIARRALAFRLTDPQTGEALLKTPPGKDDSEAAP